ncbi:hypothetical protein [Streptomyces coerulescens]|uniref:DUF2637 domain-containing protein n=1 Tax=Streptomyces coerulescens TaxID=29304 RepID=A0ABW0CN49_STRCD
MSSSTPAAKRAAVVTLAVALTVVMGAAFVASFSATVGAFSALGLPPIPAYCAAILPDGATVVAMLAVLTLKADPVARRLAVASVALFALSSGLSNASGALGVTPHHVVPERVEGVPVWLALAFSAIPVAALALSAELTGRTVVALFPAVEGVPIPEAKQSTGKGKRRKGKGPTLPPRRTDDQVIEQARTVAADFRRTGRRVTASGLQESLRLSWERAVRAQAALEAEGLA